RPESWLFRIAHNTALDALRRGKRQAAMASRVRREANEAAGGADVRVTAASGLARLLALPPAQRSCVVLIDVLGHSLEETAEVMDATVPAVKAALHRGRDRLKRLAETEAPSPPLSTADRERLRDYADRFN